MEHWFNELKNRSPEAKYELLMQQDDDGYSPLIQLVRLTSAEKISDYIAIAKAGLTPKQWENILTQKNRHSSNQNTFMHFIQFVLFHKSPNPELFLKNLKLLDTASLDWFAIFSDTNNYQGNALQFTIKHGYEWKVKALLDFMKEQLTEQQHQKIIAQESQGQINSLVCASRSSTLAFDIVVDDIASLGKSAQTEIWANSADILLKQARLLGNIEKRYGDMYLKMMRHIASFAHEDRIKIISKTDKTGANLLIKALREYKANENELILNLLTGLNQNEIRFVLNQRDEKGYSALYYALIDGNTKLIQSICTLIHQSCTKEDIALLLNPPAIDAPDLLNYAIEFKPELITPIIEIAAQLDSEDIKSLLKTTLKNKLSYPYSMTLFAASYIDPEEREFYFPEDIFQYLITQRLNDPEIQHNMASALGIRLQQADANERKMISSLYILKQKVLELNGSPKYEKASELYQGMHQAIKSYVEGNKTEEDKQKVHSACKSAVEKAQPTLKIHRGLKKALDVLLKVLIGITGIGLVYLHKKGLFSTPIIPTDSTEKMDKVLDATSALTTKPPAKS